MSDRFNESVSRIRGKKGLGGLAATLDDEQSVVAAYERWAPIYDPVFGFFTTIGRRSAMSTINELPDGALLEVGVGTGISLPLYKKGFRITGIDLSPPMLSRAEKRVARRGIENVEGLFEMDAAHLKFGDASFDTAVAMFVMTVVPDPQRVLSEIVRVVRSGGHVVLVNHFSVEKGPRAAIERSLSRYAGTIGWHPEFRLEEVTGHPDLTLLSQRHLPPADLFTSLVFRRH